MKRWLALLLLAAQLAFAQADPPARVGHAGTTAGTVEIAPEGDDWQPAEPGLPLTTGSTVRTAAASRAELHIGSTALRLGVQTEIEFERLDDAAIVVVLRAGRLSVRVENPGLGPLTVVAEALRLQTDGRGNFHVDLDATRRAAMLRVFDGRATLGAQVLDAGQQWRADARSGAVQLQGPAERTPLDNWADRREAREERQARYTPPEMTGAQALDGHGAWRVLPRLGPVWIPRAVGPDWAPFREGRWAWIAPWGWTWIDAAPWGFVTSHYGRWGFAAGRWGWLPGDERARPVYAPALVGFYGAPPGGWGAAGDVVGWYPLGPGEAYEPAYAAGSAYVQALNAPHAAPLPRGAPAHRYAQTSFAATLVPQAAFGDGQPVARARLELAAGAIGRAPALGSAMAPPPPRQALRVRKRRP